LASSAWLAFGLADVVQQRKLIDGSEGDGPHRRRLTAHLDAMLALCETVECRRGQLLAYFGQHATACGNCDTCLSPPESWDGTVPAQKLLSTVWRLAHERNQRFGVGQSVDILLGRSTDKISQWKHDTLSTYGIGTELQETEWRGVARQLLAQGLLTVSGEHQTLALTPDSGEVLGGRRTVLLRREAPKAARPSRSSRAAAAPDLPAAAAPVFERLRAWRAATAKEEGVPAYVVFHDATLRQIALDRPGSLEEVGAISGIGENKLRKYGQQVLDTLAG
jgi:ATP-dependent DNA helicase RecQ